MTTDFFIKNRARLGQEIAGGVAVVGAYAAMQRGNDAAAVFEQEANFWWLTGVEQPDWWAIIDTSQQKTWLVRPIISETHQIFDGSLDDEQAMRVSGAQATLSYEEAIVLLRDKAKKHSVVYSIGEHPHAEHFDFVQNPAPKKLWAMLERTFTSVKDCRLELSKLRAIKQPEEIKAIKKAIALTADAFDQVKAKLPALHYEYEVEAEFSYAFRKNGASGHAYDPIVAGGKNACTLHYNTNNDKLKTGLLLLDIGARVDGYAADITRTWAIGNISDRQKAVHHAVEVAHKKIISLLQPGLSVEAYQDQVDDSMREALASLDLLHTDDDYRKYFPHAISHGLGVDVHDSLGRPSVLLPGMVLTVEPGIYIPEEGIGVRIEDDILITEKGHTNLSKRLSTGV